LQEILKFDKIAICTVSICEDSWLWYKFFIT